ncbi:MULTISPECIES: hypothetical protein [unclassified Rickettsia]
MPRSLWSLAMTVLVSTRALPPHNNDSGSHIIMPSRNDLDELRI